MLVCEKCGKQAPMFDGAGKHNFCPANDEDGKLIRVCMDCKMKEIVKRWAKERS